LQTELFEINPHRKKNIENNNLINQLAEKRNQLLTVERQVRELRAEFNVA